MPLETITVTVGAGGANPQTKQVQINVDPNSGSGSGTVSFTGAHGGFDTVQATSAIAGGSQISNVANLAWQTANGVVSLIQNVTWAGFANPGGHETWHGLGSPLGGLAGLNSVIANQVVNNNPIAGLVSPDGKSGEFSLSPPRVNLVTATGTWASDDPLPYSGSFVSVQTGQIVVSRAGVQTLYVLADDSWACYLGPDSISGQQPSRVQGTFTLQPNGSSPSTPLTADQVGTGAPAWPLMGTRNTAAGNVQPTDYMYINFPAPGIYPFLFWWINGSGQTYFQPTFAAGSAQIPGSSGIFGGVMLPTALQAAPAATTPAGNLQLSLANGALHVVGDTVTLNVSVNGIHYTTKNYIPILEGTTGNLFLYNDPTNSVFNFQTYNGQPVDKTSAATAVFALSGNNTSWQGRLSVTFDGTKFNLTYNGAAFDNHVDVTQLAIAADDIAWFNAGNKSYDVFSATNSGGGIEDTIEVDYMVNASVASVTPNSVTADGAQHVFTITLAKPISPQQQGAFNTGNTINISTTWSGGVVTNSVSPNLDSQGWLLGWNVTATVPSSSVNSTATLNATISGNLTYLSGNSFTTGTVTYVNNQQIASITLQGAALTGPNAYSFSTSGAKSGAPPNIQFSGSVTLTAQVYSALNNVTSLGFLREPVGSSARTSLGAGVLQGVTNGTVNGRSVFITTFALTITANTSTWPAGFFSLGYTATDGNGLSVTYWDPSNYFVTVPSGGGGGGGVS